MPKKVQEMTITKGLVELKLLDKKINKKIVDGIFVSAVKGESKTTMHNVSKEDLDKSIKGDLQSVRALIEYRNNVKTAIVNSNAKTKVKIHGKDYTVASAIERKNSIEYEEALVHRLERQLSEVSEVMEENNQVVDANLKTILQGLTSSEKPDKTAIEATTVAYKRLNDMSLFDPIKIREVIEKMTEDIDGFTGEVDTALSESNARTLIKVEV